MKSERKSQECIIDRRGVGTALRTSLLSLFARELGHDVVRPDASAVLFSFDPRDHVSIWYYYGRRMKAMNPVFERYSFELS